MVGYAVASGTTLLMAALAFFLFGKGVAAAIIAAWLTLAATGAGLVALLAHTFDRFDVTQDPKGDVEVVILEPDRKAK